MVYQSRSTFVRRDIDILNDTYHVDEFMIPSSALTALVQMIKIVFLLLARATKYDFVVIQGAGYHSLLPVILGKLLSYRTVIIAIGTDCVSMPEIDYGNFRRPPLSWATAASFRNADLILPVHKSLIERTVTYCDLKYPDQGIRNMIPSINTPMIELCNGYDVDKWRTKTPIHQRPKSFLSVSSRLTDSTFILKGFDLVFGLAEAFPDHDFTLVGSYQGERSVPPNVVFLDNMDQRKLLEVYSEHRFYLQLSMSEGFPNALCEAMLCNCIPIGSNVAGIPEIIGNEGYIQEKKDLFSLVHSVDNALKSDRQFNPRQRIMTFFDLSKRRHGFLHHLNSIPQEP